MLSVFSDSDAVEPIESDLVRAHVKIDTIAGEDTLEDQLVEEVLIPAARQRGEIATRRQFRGPVTYDLVLPRLPREPFIEMPRPPFLSLVSFAYLDTTGAEQTLIEDTDIVVLAPSGEKPGRARIALTAGTSWPATLDQADAVRIRFTCGYGASLPGILKQAMLLDIGTLYADRENVVKGTSVAELPGGRRGIYWAYCSLPTQVLPDALGL